ncbi:pectinesterase [Ranunculus cassubicifolius]
MGFKSCLVIIFFVWIHRATFSWGFDEVHLCGFTRYPKHCVETISELGLEPKNSDVISILVEKLRNETMMLIPDPSNPKYQSASSNDEQGLAPSTGYCVELMNMSLRRLDQSLLALKDSPSKSKEDIQTWLSAVMTFQSSCRDSLNGNMGDFQVRKMEYLSRLASNTLALVNRITDEPTNTTSSEGFPQWVTIKTRKLLRTTGIRANAIVAKDGSGHYRTVSDAIKAASGERFVIYVKAGYYKEKIHTSKDGITLIGAGRYSTIIGYGDNANGGTDMPGSSTFTITGDGFIAQNIGFQNYAGAKGGQAVAMNIASDRAVFYRCSIAGYQDTLFALALRQFYRECDIYGTIDFIFGNAAAVFQNSYIILRRPLPGQYNVIFANSREDPGQNTGFSLQKCTITAASDFSPYRYSVASYLGRPWRKYARSVIMQSYIGDAIKPRGWIEWDNNFALSTLYFGEYSNTGPRAPTSNRVRWPGHHVIGSSEASQFTVARLIGGSAWLPSTGISFISGLS